jgi:hypothetical protein
MATERLSMRHVREILRLKWVVGLSHREVARSIGLSAGAVGGTISRAKAAAGESPRLLSQQAIARMGIVVDFPVVPEKGGRRVSPCALQR